MVPKRPVRAVKFVYNQCNNVDSDLCSYRSSEFVSIEAIEDNEEEEDEDEDEEDEEDQLVDDGEEVDSDIDRVTG